jgi:hypothetical protein
MYNLFDFVRYLCVFHLELQLTPLILHALQAYLCQVAHLILLNFEIGLYRNAKNYLLVGLEISVYLHAKRW